MKDLNQLPDDEISISEMKSYIKGIKSTILEDIENGTEDQVGADFILAIIANLEEELKDVKDSKNLHDLELRKQTKLLAHVMFLQASLGMNPEDLDDLDDELDFDEIDEEYDIDDEDDLEDEDDKPKKGRPNILKY